MRKIAYIYLPDIDNGENTIYCLTCYKFELKNIKEEDYKPIYDTDEQLNDFINCAYCKYITVEPTFIVMFDFTRDSISINHQIE